MMAIRVPGPARRVGAALQAGLHSATASVIQSVSAEFSSFERGLVRTPGRDTGLLDFLPRCSDCAHQQSRLLRLGGPFDAESPPSNPLQNILDGVTVLPCRHGQPPIGPETSVVPGPPTRSRRR